mgnify:CR=1 FL=1
MSDSSLATQSTLSPKNPNRAGADCDVKQPTSARRDQIGLARDGCESTDRTAPPRIGSGTLPRLTAFGTLSPEDLGPASRQRFERRCPRDRFDNGHVVHTGINAGATRFGRVGDAKGALPLPEYAATAAPLDQDA